MSLDPIVEGLLQDVIALKRQVANLAKPEYPLGLSLMSETALTGAAASVSFSSLSQTYRNLQIICQARSSTAAETDLILLRFNADSGSNYDIQVLAVNNATLTGAVSRANSSIGIARMEGANSRANNFSPSVLWVFGYAQTDREKWVRGMSANFGDVSADADLREEYRTGRWRSTAAITSITLIPNSGGNFASGSIFQLYGMR